MAIPTAQSGDLAATDVIETRVATPGTPGAATDPDVVVCKDVANTGTRLTERVCKTQGQIAVEQAQEEANRHMRSLGR